MEKVIRRVVCAANRDKSGAIILGARHWDASMHLAYKWWAAATNHITKDMRFTQQGFIDQNGVYMGREEAWLVAEAVGQIIRRVGGDMSPDGVGKLFSENLY